VTWHEAHDGASGELGLCFEAPDVSHRVDKVADLFAPELTLEHELPLPSG
jgi:hypothetical protein